MNASAQARTILSGAECKTGRRVAIRNGRDSWASLIVIVETENDDALMKFRTEWDDDFDIAVYGAMTAERGLQVAKQMAA